MSATANSNNTYTTDYGELYNQTWADTVTANNQFSWVNHLLVPAAQAAANITLLNWQKDQHDENADEAQAIIEQSLEAFCECIEANLPDFLDAYPRTPEAAKYVAPDLCKEQQDAICCNINSLLKSKEFIKLLDMFHIDQHVKRMKTFDMDFVCKLRSYNDGIKQLLGGFIGQETILETLTDEAELAAATGRIGNLCRGSRVSLGLTKLRMEELGRDRFERAAAMWNQISPVDKLGDARTMMVTPQQRTAWAITLSQLVQNSLQNEYNIAASGDPAKMAQLQTKLQKCLQTLIVEQGKASAVNQFVPNYAGILQPQINSITQGIGSSITAGLNGFGNNSIGTTQSPYVGNTTPAYSAKGGLPTYGGSGGSYGYGYGT